MRTLGWYDLKWSKTNVTVNEEYEISGKVHFMNAWPATLRPPERAFVNVGQPGAMANRIGVAAGRWAWSCSCRNAKLSMNYDQMTLAICMGGRVAEEFIFGKDRITSGAQSDIEQATKLARASFRRNWEPSCMATTKTRCSWAIRLAGSRPFPNAQKIDAEVRRLVEAGLADATRILN